MPLATDSLLHVLRNSGILALLSCAGTCDAFRAAVATELRTRFVSLLEPFFRERVRHFLGLLRLHDAIVSGSTALALFLWPVAWEAGDLDVYVGESAYEPFVVDFERLFPVALEADLSRRYPGAYNGIKRVRRYTTPTGKRIEVIQSRSPNAAAPLLYFWSSIVVNFVTSQGAVCAFPSHTLTGTGFIASGHPVAKTAAARKKYEDRGFTFTENDSWRVAGDSRAGGARVFATDPILVLDFDTVWPVGSAGLPISREGSDWVLNPALPRDQPAPPDCGAEGPIDLRCSLCSNPICPMRCSGPLRRPASAESSNQSYPASVA